DRRFPVRDGRHRLTQQLAYRGQHGFLRRRARVWIALIGVELVEIDADPGQPGADVGVQFGIRWWLDRHMCPPRGRRRPSRWQTRLLAATDSEDEHPNHRLLTG